MSTLRPVGATRLDLVALHQLRMAAKRGGVGHEPLADEERAVPGRRQPRHIRPTLHRSRDRGDRGRMAAASRSRPGVHLQVEVPVFTRARGRCPGRVSSSCRCTSTTWPDPLPGRVCSDTTDLISAATISRSRRRGGARLEAAGTRDYDAWRERGRPRRPAGGQCASVHRRTWAGQHEIRRRSAS